MAEIRPVQGKDRILMFRLLTDSKKDNATKLALQTEHTWSLENETETKQTKDGAIATSGTQEHSLEITAVASNDEINELLYKAANDQLELEVWDINIKEKGTGQNANKYKAKYARGFLSSWEDPANAEEVVEFSTSMTVNGKPVEGYATLSDSDVAEYNASYGFYDTTPVQADTTTSAQSSAKSTSVTR